MFQIIWFNDRFFKLRLCFIGPNANTWNNCMKRFWLKVTFFSFCRDWKLKNEIYFFCQCSGWRCWSSSCSHRTNNSRWVPAAAPRTRHTATHASCRNSPVLSWWDAHFFWPSLPPECRSFWRLHHYWCQWSAEAPAESNRPNSLSKQ